jgi:two-component system phosphate regulon sensor histidine kinase PhoR
VESILQVDKLDKQKIKLNKENIHLNILLHKVADYTLQSHPSLSSANINFIEEDKFLQLQADPLHLFNVMYNLMDNAIKYSNESVLLTVSAYRKKNGIEFQITDQGIGLNKSDLNKIFNKFYRIENNIRNKGFGIGLYYVKLVVSAHGGYVTVESEPGKGSTFSVFLPTSL